MAQLLFVRHAIAEDLGHGVLNDFERGLTAEGRNKFKKTAKGLKHWLPSIDLILTSPLVRTMQTSEILSKTFGHVVLEVCPFLAPGSELDPVIKVLQKWSKVHEVIACVGNEPSIGKLSSLFLAPDVKRSFMPFKKGGAALLSFPGELKTGEAVLNWFVERGHV